MTAKSHHALLSVFTDFITAHLDVIYRAVDHTQQVEREGCARGFGYVVPTNIVDSSQVIHPISQSHRYCASSHLDSVIEKLHDIGRTEMVCIRSRSLYHGIDYFFTPKTTTCNGHFFYLTPHHTQVRKSTGFLGLSKDKSESDVARIKATVMLSYGYVALYSPPDLITSRIEVLLCGCTLVDCIVCV